MRLPYAVSGVVASSLPRRLSIACAAAFLILGGCSTYEAGGGGHFGGGHFGFQGAALELSQSIANETGDGDRWQP
jgi:hypothetical protein